MYIKVRSNSMERLNFLKTFVLAPKEYKKDISQSNVTSIMNITRACKHAKRAG